MRTGLPHSLFIPLSMRVIKISSRISGCQALPDIFPLLLSVRRLSESGSIHWADTCKIRVLEASQSAELELRKREIETIASSVQPPGCLCLQNTPRGKNNSCLEVKVKKAFTALYLHLV